MSIYYDNLTGHKSHTRIRAWFILGITIFMSINHDILTGRESHTRIRVWFILGISRFMSINHDIRRITVTNLTLELELGLFLASTDSCQLIITSEQDNGHKSHNVIMHIMTSLGDHRDKICQNGIH